MPLWLGFGLIAVLGLLLAAVLSFELWDATGRRQRWQYRRSVGSAPM